MFDTPKKGYHSAAAHGRMPRHLARLKSREEAWPRPSPRRAQPFIYATANKYRVATAQRLQVFATAPLNATGRALSLELGHVHYIAAMAQQRQGVQT